LEFALQTCSDLFPLAAELVFDEIVEVDTQALS
jgi:hypothetical protein